MKRNLRNRLSPISTALLCLLAMSLTAFAACVRDGLPDLTEGMMVPTEIGATDNDMTSETMAENGMVTSCETEKAEEHLPDEDSSAVISEESFLTPETTSPETTKPETTKPETTVPETTVPETTKPETTKPTPPETEPAETESDFPSSSVSEYERRVVELVNEIRRQNGLGVLTLNEELCHVAREKSRDMKTRGYFSHTSPTYGSPFDMMKAFGISYRAAGENIAMGYPTPEAVVEGWMNSDGHRTNILNASFSEIGMGYVAQGHYWTQMFIG